MTCLDELMTQCGRIGSSLSVCSVPPESTGLNLYGQNDGTGLDEQQTRQTPESKSAVLDPTKTVQY